MKPCQFYEECGRPAEYGPLCLVHEKRRRSAPVEPVAKIMPATPPRRQRRRRTTAKTTQARTRKTIPVTDTTEARP